MATGAKRFLRYHLTSFSDSHLSDQVLSRRAAIEYERHIYPTNRGDSDTIQLTLPELKLFGEIAAELHKLTAENLR